MWIQVRSMDGKKSVQVDGLSKLTKIEDLRAKLEVPFEAPSDRQRLFYRGKQLEDGHSLFDYNVGLNEIVQILVRSNPKTSITLNGEANCNGHVCDSHDKSSESSETPSANEMDAAPSTSTDSEEFLNSLYKVGDIVDAMDLSMGAWFEARIEVMSVRNNDRNGNAHHNITGNTTNNMPTGREITAENVSEDYVDGICEVDASNKCNHEEQRTDTQEGSDSSSMNVNGELAECDNKTNASEHNQELTNGVTDDDNDDDGFVYTIKWEGYEEFTELCSKYIRPRARTIYDWSDVQVGMKVMANYNSDHPEQRGYWYDVEITDKKESRTQKELYGTIHLGIAGDVLQNCHIVFVDEIFKIEKASEISRDVMLNSEDALLKRTTQPDCDRCKDNPRRKCKFCACHICGGKHDPDKQLMCDECDMAYHLNCLDPPLESIPDEDDWYCPACKNDDSVVVKAGEKLKGSKKKQKMASATSSTNRDWGKGMACVGRTKVCTIVPSNHFGEIPGVHVGQMWKFRVQVSEAGVHRPHVAGIHGRENEGAYSIVLSGGYEDDFDEGDRFTYTGSGGRDLSGNKRTAEQSCDQKLTKMNLALALNVNAPLNKEKGNEAQDWRAGKPVRVVRNCKGRKHSKYSPEEGNRYDGIYKIVKYWPEKGKSGFLVWRYMLRRDDPNPAPWTTAGKKKIKELGLKLEYPDGYLEAQKNKEEQENKSSPTSDKGKGKGKKRKIDGSPRCSPAKKSNMQIPSDVKHLVKNDQDNKKLWDEVTSQVKLGKKFVEAVEDIFMCICCQEVVYKPVTTPCQHNICKDCLQRSFRAQVYTCPACRNELGKGYSMVTNAPLQLALKQIFPGYENGR
ncbi:E3 ubiquitin-protein ligase UHRF1-like [Ptychodera flava]|uniref:E3 ubiquitin-protein ligase UHRF1-like n=1 Tax=Ptychodera flava TaxID=63121 RepID=UPI003969BB67